MGRLEVLSWIFKNGYGNIKQVKKYAHKVCKAAAAEGNIEILEWAESNMCLNTYFITFHASANNQIAVLMWIFSKGYGNIEQLGNGAAAAGNLELLRLAILKGYLFTSETMHNAIINGHYEMFRYLRKCGCPITYKDEKLRMIYFSSF